MINIEKLYPLYTYIHIVQSKCWFIVKELSKRCNNNNFGRIKLYICKRDIPTYVCMNSYFFSFLNGSFIYQHFFLHKVESSLLRCCRCFKINLIKPELSESKFHNRFPLHYQKDFTFTFFLLFSYERYIRYLLQYIQTNNTAQDKYFKGLH